MWYWIGAVVLWLMIVWAVGAFMWEGMGDE